MGNDHWKPEAICLSQYSTKTGTNVVFYHDELERAAVLQDLSLSVLRFTREISVGSASLNCTHMKVTISFVDLWKYVQFWHVQGCSVSLNVPFYRYWNVLIRRNWMCATIGIWIPYTPFECFPPTHLSNAFPLNTFWMLSPTHLLNAFPYTPFKCFPLHTF